MHELVTLIAKYFVALPVLGVLIVLWKVKGSGRTRLALTLVLSAVFAIVLVKLATTVYHDPRPFIRDGVKPYFASSTDNGFPSDHATFSALLALVVYGVSRKLGIGLAVVAVLIGAARVIAGVHHTQDIIGGFCIAAVSYGASWFAVRLVLRTKTASSE